MSMEQERDLIACENVGKTFQTPTGDHEVVRSFHFTAKENEFIALFGPGQCGKSTIINMLAGLEPVTTGTITVNGNPVLRPGPERGVVFQNISLFPWLTTMGNVEYGLRMAGVPKKERWQRAQKYIDLVGLQGFEDAFPSKLSGGMKQRAALIRTLALDPQLLLLDEPFSALDYQTRLMVSSDICQLIRKAGKTMIIVTHDLSEAISLADKVYVLSARPATIKTVLPIQLTLQDSSPLAARNAPEFPYYFKQLWEELTDET